jgi:hypothetical protein
MLDLFDKVVRSLASSLARLLKSAAAAGEAIDANQGRVRSRVRLWIAKYTYAPVNASEIMFVVGTHVMSHAMCVQDIKAYDVHQVVAVFFKNGF